MSANFSGGRLAGSLPGTCAAGYRRKCCCAGKLSTGIWIVIAFTASLLAAGVQAREPDWLLYDQLLFDHVKRGELRGIRLNQVDYHGLAQDPRFKALVEQLSQFPVSALTERHEKLAFYINAYNILALKVVIDHWPVASIKDVGSWLRPVWKRPAGMLDGQQVTLDEIEHGILRPMGEPRIHFAIVCASISCPDLLQQAYRADRLDTQLDQQVDSFLANPGKGFRQDGQSVAVSKLFDWFSEDFAGSGGVDKFIQIYRPLNRGVVQHYLDYHWEINGL